MYIYTKECLNAKNITRTSINLPKQRFLPEKSHRSQSQPTACTDARCSLASEEPSLPPKPRSSSAVRKPAFLRCSAFRKRLPATFSCAITSISFPPR